jgi:hypothetical protein
MRDISIDIATSYGLNVWGSIPGGGVGRNFFLIHRIQTGTGAHLVSYTMGSVGSFPGGKVVGREADHSPPSSA